MLLDFTLYQTIAIGLLFIWTGFVRTGLGFGGAALGLPLFLFVRDQPLFWLPIISVHLLFFSGLTLFTRLHNVDWAYLRYSSIYIVPPALIGVLGLISLPALWLNIFIYSVTLVYGVFWLLNYIIASHHNWVDKFLLIMGGYIAGTSLSGAPLIVAVFMRKVRREQLRDTLFVLWFALVSIKMSTFLALSVELNFIAALSLIPVAAIGHFLGLRAHESISANDIVFKRWMGGGVVVISLLGLWSQISAVI